ncbi:hypothetical protein IMZ11_35925 [Microtetraspora sp. AC03309]|nr:hypothetical protein [Microtetraspora sp. AC03309]
MDPRALAEWLFATVSGDNYGLSNNAISDYAPVLGDQGMVRLRALVDAAPASGPNYSLLHMAEQAARPLGVEAVVDVLARDLRTARQYTRICEESVDAGRDEQALEQARRGLDACNSRTDHGLRELRALTVTLYGSIGRTGEAVELAWEAFADTPSLEAYKTLCEHATTEGSWPSWRERALAVLEAQPRIDDTPPSPYGYRPPGHSTLIHVLLWEGEDEAAWSAAQRGGCADGLRLGLARRRALTHPEDAVPVFHRLIEAAVALTQRDGYDRTLSMLGELRSCHQRMNSLDEFDAYVTRLRNANRRKHRFAARLEKALTSARAGGEW